MKEVRQIVQAQPGWYVIHFVGDNPLQLEAAPVMGWLVTDPDRSGGISVEALLTVGAWTCDNFPHGNTSERSWLMDPQGRMVGDDGVVKYDSLRMLLECSELDPDAIFADSIWLPPYSTASSDPDAK
ncbi:hypothetical protein CKO35_15525 [Ectothiorhodospira shaposhnikovii]|uniref:hypothetical protein n=1 Tax=Ectothiorhodospira shaposhnikovii TaxID=1054 RepID=UPI0019048914|nr:hypothetical protein [Ectothiorhodospira shaposhnikovii]MBK1674673.1 hypothetical protein [Ectothiorhodospira shaposhnikovii]